MFDMFDFSCPLGSGTFCEASTDEVEEVRTQNFEESKIRSSTHRCVLMFQREQSENPQIYKHPEF